MSSPHICSAINVKSTFFSAFSRSVLSRMWFVLKQEAINNRGTGRIILALYFTAPVPPLLRMWFLQEQCVHVFFFLGFEQESGSYISSSGAGLKSRPLKTRLDVTGLGGTRRWHTHAHEFVGGGFQKSRNPDNTRTNPYENTLYVKTATKG